MTLYLGWTMVQAFTYKRIECKKNKILVWCIDRLTTETVHDITERSKDQTILHKFLFGLHMISQWWIDRRFYHYIDQSNVSLIVWWLFENRDFVWQILNILSIVEVDWLLMNWKMVDRLMLSMWAEFLSWAKKIGCWKGSKTIQYYNLCTKLSICRKYQGITSSLNLKLA